MLPKMVVTSSQEQRCRTGHLHFNLHQNYDLCYTLTGALNSIEHVDCYKKYSQVMQLYIELLQFKHCCINEIISSIFISPHKSLLEKTYMYKGEHIIYITIVYYTYIKKKGGIYTNRNILLEKTLNDEFIQDDLSFTLILVQKTLYCSSGSSRIVRNAAHWHLGRYLDRSYGITRTISHVSLSDSTFARLDLTIIIHPCLISATGHRHPMSRTLFWPPALIQSRYTHTRARATNRHDTTARSFPPRRLPGPWLSWLRSFFALLI